MHDASVVRWGSMMRSGTSTSADLQVLADCYHVFVEVFRGGDSVYPPAVLEQRMVKEMIRNKQVKALAGLLVERVSSMPTDDPLTREFWSRLTPSQDAFVRRLTAPARSTIMRILARGRVRDEDEYHQLRLYLDAIETDAARNDEVNRIRSILDAFG
jgi:hypothetical protein